MTINARFDITDLIEEIQSNTEWLETSEGDEVACVGIENLQSILSRHLHLTIKITE